MKQLKRRTELLLLAIALGMICTASIHVYYISYQMFIISIIINILVTCCLFTLLTMTYRQLIIAKLIIDNRILTLDQAQIISEENGLQRKVSKQDIYISCFGVLIGTQPIKFNLERISLQAAELGEDYIAFTYGTEKSYQKIRILCEKMRIQDMIRITEKFRYETGITPVLTDDR